VPDMGDMVNWLKQFANTFLTTLYIPILLIMVFLTVVRFFKSNLAGLLTTVGVGAVLGVMIAGSSYMETYPKGLTILVPVVIAYIIGGFYHSAYREKYNETDRVLETVKAQIQKEIADKKIELIEKRTPGAPGAQGAGPAAPSPRRREAEEDF
jgi:hypothetical protein